MTQQALKFYKEQMLPPLTYEPFIAMVRTAFGDKYADMAGIPHSALDLAAAPAKAVSSTVGGLFGGLADGTAKKAAGTNPYDEILGVASKAFNSVQEYAVKHGKDDQPQMHQELHDNR
ncbi:hypothetical protein [Streptomyces sp. NPDC101150]|uniref:hypothetical protein n=1 Tax=Streptomyces sp. NPDC101150 TaxID=3366114 RepID=UPI003817C4C7